MSLVGVVNIHLVFYPQGNIAFSITEECYGIEKDKSIIFFLMGVAFLTLQTWNGNYPIFTFFNKILHHSQTF